MTMTWRTPAASLTRLPNCSASGLSGVGFRASGLETLSLALLPFPERRQACLEDQNR